MLLGRRRLLLLLTLLAHLVIGPCGPGSLVGAYYQLEGIGHEWRRLMLTEVIRFTHELLADV